jgi:xanthine dehydrogenase YagR molybdenum-binding subunit
MRCLNSFSAALADYAVPVHADMPVIDVSFIDAPDFAFNEFGILGLGEIGLPGVAAAIANAAFHATGHRFRNLPIDLHKLGRL